MKKTYYILLIGMIFTLPTSLYAAESSAVFMGPLSIAEERPVQFSFSLSPSADPTVKDDLYQDSSLEGLAANNPVLKIDTNVESGAIHGGLSYFRGSANNQAADFYSSSYFSDGLDIPDNFLVLPNDSFTNGTNSKNFLSSVESGQMQAISLYGGYKLTPSLKIKGAFLISKTKKETEAVDQATLNESSYNWWVDLGGDYKLNENMTYSINFGYSDSDEPYAELNNSENVQGSVYLFNNQLNMSF